MIIKENLSYWIARLRERLWFRPLQTCAASLIVIYLVKKFDQWKFASEFPEISVESVQSLLNVMATSMLMVATLAVTSMVSAYSSASNTATPRSFPLMVADSISQRALSTFIGAFIFSLISLITIENSYYDIPARFALFVVTLAVLATVILVFVHWVDHIARLGRLSNSIEKIELATKSALSEEQLSPTVYAQNSEDFDDRESFTLFVDDIGYLRNIEVSKLQSCAEKNNFHLRLLCLPGTFIGPGKAVAEIACDKAVDESILEDLKHCFTIGKDRKFDTDPRFGFITLSEIASRALSPAVNDPGTAIVILGTMVRLLSYWAEIKKESKDCEIKFDRIYAASLDIEEVLRDAFGFIARDGASRREVGIRLQKSLYSLTFIGDEELTKASIKLSDTYLKLAEKHLDFDEDLTDVKAAAELVKTRSTNESHRAQE